MCLLGRLFDWWHSLSKESAASWLHWSDIALLVATAITGLGVLGEYKGRKTWHKFFEGMVVVGVLGEFLTEGSVWQFSEKLQSIEDTELADTRTLAGNAVDSLNSLTEQYKTEKKNVSDAITELGKQQTAANEAIDRSKTAVAKLEGTTRHLNAEIDASLKEIADAREALTPRHLDQEAVMKAVANLSKVAVGIVASPDDESKSFADFIEFVFQGWRVMRGADSKFLPDGIVIAYLNSYPGVIVPKDGAGAAAFALCKELNKQNIETSITPQLHWQRDWPEGLPTNGIAIFVGRKPNPFLEKIYAHEGMKRTPLPYEVRKGARCISQ